MESFRVDTSMYPESVLPQINCVIEDKARILGYKHNKDELCFVNHLMNKTCWKFECYKEYSLDKDWYDELGVFYGVKMLTVEEFLCLPEKTKFEKGKLYINRRNSIVFLCTENTDGDYFRGIALFSKDKLYSPIEVKQVEWNSRCFEPFTGTIENGKIKI